MPNDFAPLLPAVCDIARQAGAAIMTVYATDFTAERKADGSPVTEADTAAEAIILPVLRAQTPDIPIVSEEHMAEGEAPDVSGGSFWLVDPLDGTLNFLHGLPHFAISIALERDGQLVAGQRPPIGVGADEGEEPRVDDVELHVGVRAAVLGAVGGALVPGVAGQALVGVQFAGVEHLALVHCGPLHDQVEGAAIGRRFPDLIEAVLQFVEGEVLHRQSLPDQPARPATG